MRPITPTCRGRRTYLAALSINVHIASHTRLYDVQICEIRVAFDDL